MGMFRHLLPFLLYFLTGTTLSPPGYLSWDARRRLAPRPHWVDQHGSVQVGGDHGEGDQV